MMQFKEYLKNELEKPVGEHYDPNGNSPRAIVSRGFYGEILWQYKDLPRRLKSFFLDFEGLNTPIGWFLCLPIIILLSPVLPLPAAVHWYKSSINEYQEWYKRTYKTDKGKGL